MAKRLLLLISLLLLPLVHFASSQWDESFSMCPNQCTCQHQAFATSPQARWIDVTVSQHHPFADPESSVKSIMCIVQNEHGFRDIVPSMPSDVQALTFLFTGASNQNITESKCTSVNYRK